MDTLTYGDKGYLGEAEGVGEANDDGIQRQSILKTMVGDNEYKALILNTEITEYEGEPAVKIISGNQQLGWLPKEIVPGFTDEKITGVAKYRSETDSYYLELYKYEIPTPKMYHYVKSKGIKPEYIFQEYSKVIDKLKQEEFEEHIDSLKRLIE